MTYCFLAAMQAELQYMIDSSIVEKEEKLGFAKVFTLNHNGTRFYAVVAGIGKVLASSSASAVLATHPDIDAYVNIGIGGSLDAKKAPLLSAIIGKDFVQHDMDTSPFGDPRGFLNGLSIVKIPADESLNQKIRKVCEENGIIHAQATMASGDQFIVDDAVKEDIMKQFDALLIDMETASFAEACYVFGKPFSCVRIVSDAVDHHAEYVQYKMTACEKASKLALALL